MKILLTGANGFIGRNIAESYLAEKYEIIVPRSFELNLTDQESVDDFFKNRQFDVVIHSAGKPGHRNSNDSTGIFYANTRMFFNLLNHQDKYKKLINIGSGAIYDMRHYQSKMKEKYAGVHIPVDEHGFCKYVIDKHIELIDNVVDFRVFGIFGKYEDYAIRFISNAICKAIFDLPITLRQNKKFDYLYIDDLMPIMEFFIENDTNYKAYNITPNNSVELLKIAEIIREMSGKDIPIYVGQEGLGVEYSGDNSRLLCECKNIKFTPIEESVEKLYKWYVVNKSVINREVLLFDK